MEISATNMPMPVMPEAGREPPRDAEVKTAVRETQASEAENSDTRSSGGGQEERSGVSPGSSLGALINEKV